MKNVKKYILFFIGTFIFSCGISFGNRSLFGGNSMAVLVVGLSLHLPVSVGTCNLLVSAIEMIIGTYFDKSHTSFISILAMFAGSYGIDIANLFIKPVDTLSLRIVYMIVGIILYCLGLAIQQSCEIGYGNLDIFIFGCKKKFKIKNYHTIRWPIDILFITSGLLLGSPVGIGTIILMFFAGILIEKFRYLVEKYIIKKENVVQS